MAQDTAQIKRYIGAGRALTTDNRLIDVNTSVVGATAIIDAQGRGYSTAAGVPWHPSGPLTTGRRAVRGKVVPVVIVPLGEIGMLPFHFGYNAGGEADGTPGAYAQQNGTLSDPIALAGYKQFGEFLYFTRFAGLLSADANVLHYYTASEAVNAPVLPRFLSSTGWDVPTYFFTRAELLEFFNTYVPIAESTDAALLDKRSECLNAFPTTGNESSGTYSGDNIDETHDSGWYGDPLGYYFMRTLYYKNPAATAWSDNALREADYYGTCLIRKRQYGDLGDGSQNLYESVESGLSSFAPFDDTYGFHGAYVFNRSASGDYPSTTAAPHGVTITATLTEDEKFPAFPYRYSIALVVSSDKGVPDTTLLYEWWLPQADVPIKTTVRVYQDANTAPVMTDLTDGLGTFTWSGTLTRLSSFSPYVAFATSLPSSADHRFDWGNVM